MATRTELAAIMAYLAADTDVELTDMKIQVWYDQFNECELKTLALAAKTVLTKKIYGKFPRVSDMWDAILENERGADDNVAIAWDDFIRAARHFGRYEQQKIKTYLENKNPRSLKALGTLLPEYFELNTDQLATFRAQFERRYREIEQSNKRESIKNSLGIEDHSIQRLVQSVQLAINGGKQR